VSIPVLREVGYTDDGCTEYQCLNCYEYIEIRNNPRPTWKGGKNWKWCPYCGCEWESFKNYDETKKKYYDNVNARTKRIRPLNFTLWSRVHWKDKDGLSDWLDWDKEATGHKEYVLQRKRYLQKHFEENNWYDKYEFKFTSEPR
jgi:hypothetical protein